MNIVSLRKRSNYRLQFWKGNYGWANGYGGEIGFYSNTDGGTWYATVDGEQEIRTEQSIIDKETGKVLIHNDVAAYTDDDKHFWNLAIRTSEGYREDDLLQVSRLYFEDESLREATFSALAKSNLTVKKGDNNELLVLFI